VIVAFWLKLPDLAVTVTGEVAGTAAAVTAKVSRGRPVGPALNPATTPVGSPDTLSVTPPEKPFCAVTDTVLEAMFPC